MMKKFQICVGLALLIAVLPAQSQEPTPEQKRIAALIEKLKEDSNPDASDNPTNQLLRIGRPAVPLLLKALTHDDSTIRSRAVTILGFMRPPDLTAIGPLLERTKDKDSGVRFSAVSALLRFDPTPKGVAEAYVRVFKEGWKASLILATYDKPLEDEAVVTVLRTALSDRDENVRWYAARALGAIGPEAKSAAPELIELLKDRNGNTLGYAAQALIRVNPRMTDIAVRGLIAALRDTDHLCRYSAADAIIGIGPAAKEATPALIEVLRSNDETSAKNAARALGSIGPAAKAAVPALLAAIKEDRDEEKGRSMHAAVALLRIDPYAEEVTSVILNFFETFVGDTKQGDWRRGHAADYLGDMRKNARPAMPTLRKALKDEHATVRVAAAQALAMIGAEAKEVVPLLIAHMKGMDREGRIHYFGPNADAARALGEIGPAAKDAVPALVEILKDSKSFDSYFYSTAAIAIWKIDPKGHTDLAIDVLEKCAAHEYTSGALDAAAELGDIGAKAVPALIRMLRDERHGRRAAAAEALGRIGPAASEAHAALSEVMNDSRASVRRLALDALGAIDADKSRAVLIERLKDPAPTVREAAARQLAKVKSHSEATRSALRKATQDPDLDVRETAATTLKGITSIEK